MDPQGRILLEQCSLALRDTEARSEHPAERETGVYVGVMHMEYIQYMTGEDAFAFDHERINIPLYEVAVVPSHQNTSSTCMRHKMWHPL